MAIYDKIFVDFVGFLSICCFIYTQCLRYNICSAWFLDIRISTCFLCFMDLAGSLSAKAGSSWYEWLNVYKNLGAPVVKNRGMTLCG